ncbi:hypothetical protein D3C78_1333100 [compost metagenome]
MATTWAASLRQGLRVTITRSSTITPGTRDTSYSRPWKDTRSFALTLRLSGSATASWRHTSTEGALINCSWRMLSHMAVRGFW